MPHLTIYTGYDYRGARVFGVSGRVETLAEIAPEIQMLRDSEPSVVRITVDIALGEE